MHVKVNRTRNWYGILEVQRGQTWVLGFGSPGGSPSNRECGPVCWPLEGEPPGEPRFRLPTPSRAGATIVELLVVTLIVAVVAVGIAQAVSAALTLQQNYREEAGVRTKLAHVMAYAERYLSLASNVGTGTVFTTSYPQETGGVSFETNHWKQVQEMTVAVVGNALNFHIVSEDESKLNQSADKALSGDGFLYNAAGDVVFVRIEGAEDKDVRRLVLNARFPVRRRGVVQTNMIEVSRPIRMWNAN